MDRNEVATHAFEAMLSNPVFLTNCLEAGAPINDCVRDMAFLAVAGADALIAELAGGAK